MMKVVFAGPPHSGKSCLREGLKQVIFALSSGNSDVPYPYVITACPDGEGAWFQETAAKYPEVARACKEVYKRSNGFSPEFVDLIANHVKTCAQPLTMVDIGGRTSPDNYEICEGATHIVILAGNDPDTGKCWNDRMKEWRKFAKDLNLKVIAEIFSDYHGKRDIIEGIGHDGILQGSVHYLKRGKRIEMRPMVQALASHILSIKGIPSISSIPTSRVSGSTYIITRDHDSILRVGFGEPSDNDRIVKEAVARLKAMMESGDLSGGGLLKINGPASLPVGIVLGHQLSHLFKAIAYFDPKLNQYVVVISHSSDYTVGDLID